MPAGQLTGISEHAVEPMDPISKEPDATSDDRQKNQIISIVCVERMTKKDLEKPDFFRYEWKISRDNGSGS